MEKLIERLKEGEKIEIPVIYRSTTHDKRYWEIRPDKGETTVEARDCLVEARYERDEWKIIISYNDSNNREMLKRKIAGGAEGYKCCSKTNVQSFLDLYSFPETVLVKTRKLGKYKISRR